MIFFNSDCHPFLLFIFPNGPLQPFLESNFLILLLPTSYEKTASIVNFAEKNKKKLEELTIVELRKIEPKLTDDVLKVFDLKNSVNSKKSYGGTSFENIKKMIVKYKKQIWLKKYFYFLL